VINQDTSPAVEQKFRQMLLKRSGAERLKMGCSMFATARALAKARVLQKHPDAGPAELKRRLFLHFYGADFEPEERDRIASALEKFRRPKAESQAQLAERPKPGTRARKPSF
jgi:hypothetical protein